MKHVLITLFSVALILGVAVAQDSATPPSSSSSSASQTSTPAQQPAVQPPHAQNPQANAGPNAGAAKQVAPGSVIPVTLAKTIDAKKAKTGDEVVARVTQDMKTNTGEVLLPKDTKVVGHVTEAQARTKEQKESEIGISFDRAVMKNGSEMQMPMSIQAIIGPQSNNNQNGAEGGGGYGAAPGTGTAANSGGGRSGGMGGSQQQVPAPNPSAGTGGVPNDAKGQGNARPPITAETKGVVGISDLKLTTAGPAANAASLNKASGNQASANQASGNPASANQGSASQGSANQASLVSSEKNNVKLESGTLMLLRVNQ